MRIFSEALTVLPSPPDVCVCSYAQLYPTLCDPMDCSLLASSVHGILQARILEWVAMPSSRGTFLTQGSNLHLSSLLHWQVGSLPLNRASVYYV